MKNNDDGHAPSGWYPDPEGNLRYWDGNTWLNIPAPPSFIPDNKKTEALLKLGENFRINVGMSIFVGYYQDLFDWPLTDNAVSDFCKLIIDDSDISNRLGLIDCDTTFYGNPRIDPSHLKSYLWALSGVVFADYLEAGIDMEASRENFNLDWNAFRKLFRKVQRESFESPSYLDDEKAPVDIFINSISIEGQEYKPTRDATVQLLKALRKANSHESVRSFLEYFNEEILAGDFLDESLVEFLWTEIVFSLTDVSGLETETLVNRITQLAAGGDGFDWDQPEQLPQLIEHNREINNRLTYNPWPWTSDSRGLWNDDTDAFYVVKRLEQTQPINVNPSVEQQVAALSSLAYLDDSFSSLISESLQQFVEEHNELIDECFDELSEQWGLNEEYSLPELGAIKISEKSAIAKKTKKVWPEYLRIIREDR